MKLINRIAILLCIFVIVLSIIALLANSADAEGHDYKDRPKDFCPYDDVDYIHMTITGDLVNGRLEPSKQATRACLPLEYGDDVKAIFWSKNHKWIEVLGGDGGSMYVYYEYITERTDIYKVKNAMAGKVRARKRPVDGGVSGYIKRGQTIKIYQTIFGWGRTDKGWVDLSCFYEIDN